MKKLIFSTATILFITLSASAQDVNKCAQMCDKKCDMKECTTPGNCAKKCGMDACTANMNCSDKGKSKSCADKCKMEAEKKAAPGIK